MSNFFIDESGDPSFYVKGNKCVVGKQGFSPVLILGMVKIDDLNLVRDAVAGFIEAIKSDPVFPTLKCANKNKEWYLHASCDDLYIQERFIPYLSQIEGFKFYAVVGRKRLDLFNKKHGKSETEFYFDIVYHLMKDRLIKDDVCYSINLAKRTKSNGDNLKKAIAGAVERDNNRRKIPVNINYSFKIVPSSDSLEMSIVDYMLWALQRYIISSQDKFYKILEHRYSLILDLYDFDNFGGKNGKTTYYNKNNRFHLDKASEFRCDGYVK